MSVQRFLKRNLPTLVTLGLLVLLSALLICAARAAQCGAQETQPASLPQFNELAYRENLQKEARAPSMSETTELTYDQPAGPQESKGGFACADKGDWERLAIVIYQEAGSDSVCDMCRYRVADVVLNRVSDPRYPDTVEGVLMDDKYGLQWGLLSVTGIVWPDKASEPGEAAAVQRAWEIAADVLEGHHSDLASDYIWCSEYKQGSDVIYCDGIYFGAG